MGIAQAKAMRAYNYFFLVNTFAKPYNPSTAATDNGIIIRTKFDLEEVGKQYSVADTYAFILKDLDEAVAICRRNQSTHINRTELSDTPLERKFISL